MTEADYTVRFKTYDVLDPRLGRNVKHDSRSLAYQVAPVDIDTLQSIKHHLNIPTLNQANLGSCTGNSSTYQVSGDLFWELAKAILSAIDADHDEKVAVDIYSAATALDSYQGTYPPTDTGSDGLSVAKVWKQRGIISGYTHATSLAAVLTALAKQPVIVGTEWRADMFNPDADGRIHITGAVQGGHEYCLDELDVENKRVWLHNSWGADWGIDGRAYLTWDDLATLLAADGDCTVFVPATQPAPQPTPVDPAQAFVAAAQEWLSHPHSSKVNKALIKPLQNYLATLKD